MRKQTDGKPILKKTWRYPDCFSIKTTDTDNGKILSGKHQKQILFLLWFKCDKMQHRLNLTPGLNILLNSKGNLMGFTVMLLRVLKSQRCCLLHSWRQEHAAEPAAVLEATGLRI